MAKCLYRDVYYPLLPLPVYVGVAATSILGSNFQVLQALFFACFIANCWLTYRCARLLKIKALPMAVLALAVAVVGISCCHRSCVEFVSALAQFFLLLSLLMLLRWMEHAKNGRLGLELTIAAIASGAGLQAKIKSACSRSRHCSAAYWLISHYRRFALLEVVKTGVKMVAIFTGTVLLTLIPTALQGGWNRLRNTSFSSEPRSSRHRRYPSPME
jgi:hypothetical protein